ncbi:MAG: emrA [Gammaproteobacteria bacterium]|nr:emrA [Gammaproteobacteria bacterium]
MKLHITNSLHKVKNSKSLQRIILFTLVAIVLSSWLGYWVYSKRYVSTDDAYVNANQIQVAAQVSGEVTKLYVANNQFVKQGQLLFELDPSSFQAALEKAQAQLAIDQAKLIDTQLSTARTLSLVKQKLLSEQQGDDAKAQLASAEAMVKLDEASLDQAQLNLGYTQVLASSSGWVSNMTLQQGSIVNANQALFTLISNDLFWVDANYEETDLQNIRPGQPAEIKLDMYPNHVFKGVVNSISGGSGAAFSLLPPENATGNWVKITQRVPVKVVIINPDPDYPLHIGTTATVTIDTHGSK